MRLAVIGPHGVGKTTLVDDLTAVLPGYGAVAEPYWHLAQNGMPFAGGPNTADLEEQLRQSCTLILAETGSDTIFDRCPLDLIAYLEVVSQDEGFEWEPDGKLLRRIEQALATLALLIFVPLRVPDDIAVTIEYPRLRARVDRRLKAMLRDDDLGLLAGGPRVVEVFGSRDERIASVVPALRVTAS